MRPLKYFPDPSGQPQTHIHKNKTKWTQYVKPTYILYICTYILHIHTHGNIYIHINKIDNKFERQFGITWKKFGGGEEGWK